MRLVFLGAPGVGKGTQADLVAKRFHTLKISTGDILREAVKNSTPLGLRAKACMDAGRLVPDEVVIGIVRDKLAESLCKLGFLLDGFPRTVPQAEELTSILASLGTELDCVINVIVGREEIIRRLTGRRSCGGCGAIFHVEYAPPAKTGVCDKCGQYLVQRSDDMRETVETRLNVYELQTAPLIEYYRRRNLLVDLNGVGHVDDVQHRLLDLLLARGIA